MSVSALLEPSSGMPRTWGSRKWVRRSEYWVICECVCGVGGCVSVCEVPCACSVHADM